MNEPHFFVGFYHFGNQAHVRDLIAAAARAKKHKVAFFQFFGSYGRANAALGSGIAG